MVSNTRKAIELLYIGRCDILNQQEVKDPETKQTHFVEITVTKAQPCRLSFETITAAENGSGAAEVTQIIKLFISPDLEIKAGSRITVTQSGRKQSYKASGEPAVYSTHQEVILRLAGDYA